MKSWQGMERNADATSDAGDGCVYAQNTRFYVEGELQRRRGLVKVDDGSLSDIATFDDPEVDFDDPDVTFDGIGDSVIFPRPLRIAQFWSPASGMRTLILTSAGTITQVMSA